MMALRLVILTRAKGLRSMANCSLCSAFTPALVRSPPPPQRSSIRYSSLSPKCSLTNEALQAIQTAGIGVMSATSTDTLGVNTAIAGGGALVFLATLLSLTDPEKRRRQQAATVGGDEKEVVRRYFNTAGFERWRKIYGESQDVNDVQLDIRHGHAQTVQKALHILTQGTPLLGLTICDAGCGTGSLTIPLALQGAIVTAADISSAMVSEAELRAREMIASSGGNLTMPRFQATDLESLQGKYHTVACIDVLIHYPQEKAADMITHLASLAESRLILSFAPKSFFMVVLKRIGELFPGPSKATRAYLHAEEDIEAALRAAGWVVRSRDMTATKFYYSRLLEAVPAPVQ